MNNPICPCIFIKKLEIQLTINYSICGWFEFYRSSWRVKKKNNQLFKGLWNEKSKKNKILSWPIDWALFKWYISPSVDIYRESIKMFLYGPIASTKFPHDCSFTWNEQRWILVRVSIENVTKFSTVKKWISVVE